MTERPTFTELVDYVEGRLPAERAASARRALEAGDPQTAQAHEWIRTFHSLAERLPLDAPPLRVRHYLQRQFEKRTAARPAGSSRIRRQLAAMIFDSRVDPATAGVRGGGDPDPSKVHLAYRCDVGDVLVELTPVPDGQVRLDGQVLWDHRPWSSPLRASVTGAGFTASAVSTDDLGRFAFARVPEAVDQLVLHLGDVDVAMTWEQA